MGAIETSGTKKDVFRDPHTRAAAALTGCKNISRAAMLPDGSFEAADWGITLRKPGFSGGCVGIRMHDVRPGRGENEVRCDVAEVIENPFSFTVLLRPAGRTDTTPVGWEMEKDVWRAQQADAALGAFPGGGAAGARRNGGTGMKKVKVQDAVGLTLCHDITAMRDGFKGAAFKRGHVIEEGDVEKLLDLGKRTVFIWEESAGEIHEEDAARRMAAMAQVEGCHYTEPSEGKVLLMADHARHVPRRYRRF